MAKTSIDLNPEMLAEARDVLGTTTTKSTVEEALRVVITMHAREQFIELASSGAFKELLDPEFRRQAWT